MIKFTDNGSALEIARSFRTKQSHVLEALVDKMSELLVNLQDKIVTEYLSGGGEGTLNQISGALADSVQAQEATVEGNFVRGEVDYGEGIPYIDVLVKGGTKWYVINPLGDEESGGTRKHKKGAVREFGSNKLAWADPAGVYDKINKDGWAYAMSVLHPPIQSHPFAQLALDSMRDEFIEGLRSAVLGALRE